MRTILRSLLLLALLAALAAASVPPASSHPRSLWYWSAVRAEHKVLTSSRGPVAFNASYLSDVDCIPIGVWIWSDSRPRQKLYKHFDCGFTVNWDDGGYQTVERIVHVLSAQDFVFSTA